LGHGQLHGETIQQLKKEGKPQAERALGRAKLLDCACLCWRFSLPPSAKQKRQKGQPHSKTLPRGREAVWNGEAFGLRLSLLALSCSATLF